MPNINSGVNVARTKRLSCEDWLGNHTGKGKDEGRLREREYVKAHVHTKLRGRPETSSRDVMGGRASVQRDARGKMH